MTEPQESFALDTVTADDFSLHVDTPFLLTLDDGREHTLTLASVTEAPWKTPSGRHGFSLMFRGTPGIVLPQLMYPLTHPALGTLEIFLVPVGAIPTETTYQAVFN